MITPPSAREEFNGFSAYYEAEIAPYLQGKEDARRSAVLQSVAIAGAAAIVVALILLFGPFGEANLQVAFVGGAIGLGAAGWRLNKTRNEIADNLTLVI